MAARSSFLTTRFKIKTLISYQWGPTYLFITMMVLSLMPQLPVVWFAFRVFISLLKLRSWGVVLYCSPQDKLVFTSVEGSQHTPLSHSRADCSINHLGRVFWRSFNKGCTENANSNLVLKWKMPDGTNRLIVDVFEFILHRDVGKVSCLSALQFSRKGKLKLS